MRQTINESSENEKIIADSFRDEIKKALEKKRQLAQELVDSC